MKNQELLDVFNNKKFISKIIESSMDKNYFITNCNPIYTLKEALNALDDKVLNLIYDSHQNIISIGIKETNSRKEKIKILEESILTTFEEFMGYLTKEDKSIIENIIKNKYTKKIDHNLLCIGYLYGYKQDGKNVFVMPTELLEIYKNYQNSPEKINSDYRKAHMYIITYMLMNGILEKKFLEKVLIKEYGLNITKEQIDKVLNEDFTNYKKDYYVPTKSNEPNPGLDALIMIKKQFENKILDEQRLMFYSELIRDLINELNDVLKKDASDQVIYKIFVSELPIDELINQLDIPKKSHKKVKEILSCYYDLFRYWEYSGRTSNEANLYYYINNPALDEKPCFSDLSTCLNKISKEIYETVESSYKKQKKLNEQILESVKEKVNQYDIYAIQEIIEMNHEEVNDFVDSSFLDNGFMYLYKDNKKIKCFIPEEILNILEETFNDDDGECVVELIDSYINMNGIIDRETLQKLLKDNHNFDLSKKELDDACEYLDVNIMDGRYYTFIQNIDMSDVADLFELKKSFGNYKVANLDDEEKEDEFKDELLNLLYEEYDDDEKCDTAYDKIIFGIKNGVSDIEYFEEVLAEEKLSSIKKVSKKILELHNKYKNYIGVWIFNGYSLTEAFKMRQAKSDKVGRNELCPCGSNKKYKQCCGK